MFAALAATLTTQVASAVPQAAGTVPQITSPVPQPVGAIEGQVVDVRTKAPLPGVAVSLPGTLFEAASTDAHGKYIFAKLPVGSYNVAFRCEGRPELLKAEILVRSSRITTLNVELGAPLTRHEEITVSDYFEDGERSPVPAQALGAEELRRAAPGSDVTRALFVVPGVVQVDDMANDMVVRGGSPAENGFYIDNIPIPNINHFPQEGASGGNISLLDLGFVDEVRMLTGGFGAEYGDHLSSVVDVQYREGNRSEADGRLEANLLGYAGAAEGPLPGRRGSFMISGRKSNLDLLARPLGLTSFDARFADAQAKLVYDLGPRHRLSLLEIYGQSDSVRSREQARANGESEGTDQWVQNTVGLNWRALWGPRGFSNTSLSYAFVRVTGHWAAWDPSWPPYRKDSTDGAASLRNVNRLQLTPSARVDFGVEGRYLRGEALNMLDGGRVPQAGWGGAAFGTATLSRRLTSALGLRASRDPHTERLSLSPRLSASYALAPRVNLNAAYGVFTQTLPFALVKQSPANEQLAPLEARHYVAGLVVRLKPDLRLTFEAYDKRYSHFPLTSEMPARFVIDDINGNVKNFRDYGELIDTGQADSRGLELMLQQKLTTTYTFIVSGSLFRARYRDLEGVWRDRLYDNRYVLNVTAACRPNKGFEARLRFVLAGGRAATPWVAWQWPGGGTGTEDYTRWMGIHLPVYHTLGLRLDRRVYSRRASLNAYLDVWNIYNRLNVRAYIYDAATHEVTASRQWGVIPVAGLRLDF